MKKNRTSRRRFLQLAAGAGVTSGSVLLTGRARAMDSRGADHAVHRASLSDDQLVIEFDASLRSRLWHRQGRDSENRKVALSPWAAADSLVLGGGERIDEFALREQLTQAVQGRHGSGTRLRLIGMAAPKIEKTVEIELFERYPGMAFYRVSYRNVSPDYNAFPND